MKKIRDVVGKPWVLGLVCGSLGWPAAKSAAALFGVSPLENQNLYTLCLGLLGSVLGAALGGELMDRVIQRREKEMGREDKISLIFFGILVGYLFGPVIALSIFGVSVWLIG